VLGPVLLATGRLTGEQMRLYLRACPILLIAAAALLVVPAWGAVLPGHDHIMLHVANDAGAKYDTFGNDSYYVHFDGDRGVSAVHITTDPALPLGQITVTEKQTGTFFVTDTGGKAYEDELLVLVAVNGSLADDFQVRISADGYTWIPNAAINTAPELYTYQPVALNETFTGVDFSYGPQVWRPAGLPLYPLFEGQDLSDLDNEFRLAFIDLNAGVLGPNDGLVNRGAVRVNYSFRHLPSFAAFAVYGYCKNPNQGEGISWTNRLGSPGASGFSVVSPAVRVVPGAMLAPTDTDSDGLYEDVNGNGRPDFGDVVVFFNQMGWIGANEPLEVFDCNGNGRIDFADVVWLFNHL